MSDDIDTNMHAYKKRHARELDNLFRANGIIQSQVAGTEAYRRGHVWNFEWCSSDPKKAQPKKVEAVNKLMEKGCTFEEAFDTVSFWFPEPEWGSPSLNEFLKLLE